MLGAICGDIIGSVFEFDNYKAKDFELFNVNSTFTDDTILTVAIADSLLNNYSYLSNLRKYFQLYPNAGFSRTFSKWANSDQETGYGSFGNGSAMRVSPIGWAFESLEDVLKKAEATAKITHSHPEGIKGAKVVAGAIFIARNGGSKSEIRQFADTNGYDTNFCLDDIREVYKFDATCQGTVPQALVAFFEANDFKDAIRNAVSIGGDSDTLACITGGISEAYFKFIPDHIKNPCLDILDERLRKICSSFSAKYLNDKKSIFTEVPLLSLDRSSILGQAIFSHWEENRHHYFSVDDGDYLLGQTFDGWSAKVALDHARGSFEKEGVLIAVGGSLVYAVYSGMCHDMGQGYTGYNFKNRSIGDKTIPEPISTFGKVRTDEFSFVSSLAEQQEYANSPDKWGKIIKERGRNEFSLKPLLSKIFWRNT